MQNGYDKKFGKMEDGVFLIHGEQFANHKEIYKLANLSCSQYFETA